VTSKQGHALIEEWLPIEKIGAESMRERGASSALPPLYFLHVWWARRPLTVSRAAILGSALPCWDPQWPPHLLKRFPSAESYESWFLKLLGILGDPVLARKALQLARRTETPISNPYGYPRAFTSGPSTDEMEVVRELLLHAWGVPNLTVMDSFSGGGSIPLESLRYGFHTIANELNPVALIVLRATLEYPARFRETLVPHLRKYLTLLSDQVQEQLRAYYTNHPKDESLIGACYLWARTVACPYTGKPIPLSPHWWLRRGRQFVAARPLFAKELSKAKFEILDGKPAIGDYDPRDGTVRRGNAVSPWANGQAVPGSYIKSESRAGRMGFQLYGVALKKRGGMEFRPPNEADEHAASLANDEIRKRWDRLLHEGRIPTEARAGGRSDFIASYGFPDFASLFLPRQLLALTTALEVFDQVRERVFRELDREHAEAVIAYLGIAFDKAVDYSSGQVRWDATREKAAHTFSLHDFRITWNTAEIDAGYNLFSWAGEQVISAYESLLPLTGYALSDGELFGAAASSARIDLTKGSASRMDTVADKSVHVVVVDPPYYDNVMYAECADFFYVWMKRTIGSVWPVWFREELTNKDDEAVANDSRFAAMGRKKKSLAAEDYERKMSGAFKEMHRVLTDNGVLTVMFTHKKVEAWDTLATSLIGAGFAIHSSWPVHTESEHSLHQAKKNAAQSTILLTCRKREQRTEPLWWDDIKGNVRRVAREKAEEFERKGIRGVDLYIATFGPTLAILSENWPVLTSEVDERTGEPKPLRPEIALDLAREEVVALRKQGLLLGRSVTFDPFTDWYLMAWDAFQAAEFPADEALKLALALGLDQEKQLVTEKKLVSKKATTVTLQQPSARRKRGMVDPDQRTFPHWIDAAHTAMLLYTEDGSQACQHFLRETGFQNDSTFKALIQALLQAIPRTKQKGRFARPEAEVLDAMRLAFFDDLPVPPDEEVEIKTLQGDLFDGAPVAADGVDAEGIEDEGEPDEDEEDDE